MPRALIAALILGGTLSIGHSAQAADQARAAADPARKLSEARKPIVVAQAAPDPRAPAPTEAPAAPRFDINRFDVQGNSLLRAEEIDAAVGPYTGKSKDFADVQRALESLQQRYQSRGFGTVQVLLPEQELERGVIVLRVIEPKLGKVAIDGNKH